MYSVILLILRAKVIITVLILLLPLPQDWLALSARQTRILDFLSSYENWKRQEN